MYTTSVVSEVPNVVSSGWLVVVPSSQQLDLKFT